MRFLLKTVLALVALSLLAAGALWAFLPTDRILRLAADQVREATGRELTIHGAARPSLWPELGAEVEGVALSNADWAEGDALLTAEAAQISVAIWPLLSGDVQVTGLRLIRPVVDLQIDATGRRNWDMGGAPDEGAASSGRRIGIDSAAISDGALRLRDARGGRDLALTALDADLSAPDLNAPMTLRATAAVNGAPASLDLSITSLAALMAGRSTEADMTLEAAGAALSWTGAAALSDQPVLRGKITASSGAPGAALRKLGLGDLAAALPPRLALLDAATLSGDIDLGPGGLTAALASTVKVEGAEITAETRLSGGPDWRADGPIDLDATLREGDGVARITGTLRGIARFDGRVDARGAPRRIAALVGAAEALVGLPEGGLQSAALSGALRLTPSGGALTDGRLEIDGAEGTIAGDYDLTGKRPALRATLAAGAIDLRPWLGGGKAGDGAGGGWSRAPIDISALAGADVDLGFSAGPLTLPSAEIAHVSGRATVKDGAILLTVDKAELFGGAASGSARAAPGKGGIAASGAITAKDIALRPALAALAGATPLNGTGALTADFAASGPHMDALMHDLSGKGALDLRDGAINGVNLAVLVRNILTGATESAASTAFTSLTASWTMAKGDLRNQDMRMTGPLISLTGTGRIGIGARDIDYRVTPSSVAPIEGLITAKGLKGLTFPVNIRGGWSAPSFTPDLARAIPGLLGTPAAAAMEGLGLVGGAAGAIGNGLGAVLGGGGGDAAPDPAPDAAPDAAPAPAPDPLKTLKGLFRPFQ